MQLSSIRSSISSAISNFGSKLPTLTAKQKQISLIAIGVLATFAAIWAVRRYFNKSATSSNGNSGSPAIPTQIERSQEIDAKTDANGAAASSTAIPTASPQRSETKTNTANSATVTANSAATPTVTPASSSSSQ